MRTNCLSSVRLLLYSLSKIILYLLYGLYPTCIGLGYRAYTVFFLLPEKCILFEMLKKNLLVKMTRRKKIEFLFNKFCSPCHFHNEKKSF